MEEKERFEQLNDGFIYDNKLKEYAASPCVNLKYHMKSLTDLLNKQNRRIEELEDKDWYEQCIKQLEEQNTRLVQENQQLKEKLNNFETCMKKYNVEDIELLDLMLFVLSGETKYQLKKIKDKHKKELEQSQKQLAIEELEKLKAADFKKIIFYSFTPATHIENLIDDRIKSLKGEEKW